MKNEIIKATIYFDNASSFLSITPYFFFNFDTFSIKQYEIPFLFCLNEIIGQRCIQYICKHLTVTTVARRSILDVYVNPAEVWGYASLANAKVKYEVVNMIQYNKQTNIRRNV